jgi:hypothetical protein
MSKCFYCSIEPHTPSPACAGQRWRESSCWRSIRGGRGTTKKPRCIPMIRECGAKARTNGHQPCRRIAMANGRCHLHGGLTPKHNPGPKTEEAKLRQKMARWKHGMRSKECVEEARQMRAYIRECKQAL